MMNLCQCLQNNVVNSKLTYLIYSSLEALLNINVIATLEDNFKNSYELEFDFNNSNRSDDEEEKVVGTLPAGYYHPVMSL
jgi:hypothetical protein